MTKHRHSVGGKFTSETNVDLNPLATKTELAALEARVVALEKPVPPPPPPPPPSPPPVGTLPPETTLKTTTIPPASALPARGVVYADPTGTKGVRIGENGQGPLYSKRWIENANGTLLFFAYGGKLFSGVAPYAQIVGNASNWGNFNWDPSNPRYGYGTQNDENVLIRYDFQNPSSVQRTPPMADLGERITLTSEGKIADNGNVVVMSLARPGWVRVVQAQTGQILSTWWNLGGVPDSVTMSRNGQIVVAVFEPGNTGHPNEIWAYNLDGTNAHRVRVGARHGDTQVGIDGRQKWIQASGEMSDLADPTIPMVSLFDANDAFDSSHVSGTGPHGWGLYSEMNPQDNIGKLGNGQIVAVKLDGSKTVRIFGFSGGSGAGGDDAKQPQAAWSRDGTKVFFKANRNGGTYGWALGMNL